MILKNTKYRKVRTISIDNRKNYIGYRSTINIDIISNSNLSKQITQLTTIVTRTVKKEK